jgi:dCMP deaminase
MKSAPIVKKEKYMTWDTYFMSIAVLSSFRSKDKHTSNGACISDPESKIVGIGYNGLPRGLDDNNERYWKDDDNDLENSRHTYVVHAEKNAIYNSMNHNLLEGTFYVTHYPCNVCAQAIIQVGIKRVVYLKKKENTETHMKRNTPVKRMFDECNVKFDDFYSLKIDDTNFLEELQKINKTLYLENFK